MGHGSDEDVMEAKRQTEESIKPVHKSSEVLTAVNKGNMIVIVSSVNSILLLRCV